ncbi:uncharacterized protein PFL1_03587 [Pseudozyma flocculosa PF-1]|uniref:Related to ERJ5 - Type I membrane protein preserves the folding capacity of the endoplasmic reticulum n=2 Tax=Pseudozyma flocculosa TaxID=84751 RepID=A0A5C3F7Y7_9BASI|nr:uncharacterized protein PFL1_03587 [Pseudozyma flocculosa PF-1]EPQ28784.1 hypothetical protein PFL1_03587 [Pseudozyma flocculosa PF-1]SPO39431.1 related to ERJ5 - Type I membrane protein preserves the folding capacity of the endoplasmic reticulum [Pseudozyma flocculosa]
MRLTRLVPLLCLLVLACTVLGVRASNWDKDDYEIFELQNALEDSEGKGTTFYSLLDIAKTATQSEIKRAYRKKSLELHPDKNLGRPDAQKRFERLGLINKILRDSRKDRYDHFLTNGFPKWRGTGYFYQRFRPGLVSVLLGLVVFSCGIEVLIRHLNVQRERERTERLRRSAMLVAWGPRYEEMVWRNAREAAGAPKSGGLVEKKVRVPVSGFVDLPAPLGGAEDLEKVDWQEREKKWKRCVLSASAPSSSSMHGGRTVEVLVNRDEVLVHLDGEWWPLDSDAIPSTSFTSTWPFRIFSNLTASKSSTRHHGDGDEGEKGEEEEEEERRHAEQVERKARQVIAASSSSEDGAARKRKAKRK